VLVVYHGGDNGDAEKLALLEYVRGLDHKKFTVMQAHYPNLPSCPPMLICIGKNP
jgi:hypothetical protein